MPLMTNVPFSGVTEVNVGVPTGGRTLRMDNGGSGLTGILVQEPVEWGSNQVLGAVTIRSMYDYKTVK